MFTFPEEPRSGFFLIPESLIGSPCPPEGYTPALWSRLTQSAQAVLFVIASHVGDNGMAFPSEERIAGLAGLTRKTVRRALVELEVNQVLKIHHYTARSGRRAKKFEWLLTRNGQLMRFYHRVLDQGVWNKFSPSAKSLYLAFRFFGRARPDLDPNFDADQYDYGTFLSANAEEGAGEEWYEYLRERNYDFCNAEPRVLCDYAGIVRRGFNEAVASLEEIKAVVPFDNEYWQVSIWPQQTWKLEYLNRKLREAGGIK